MVSLFHPHSMCKKVERVTVKTGCTLCTKWTISFKVSGFRTKTHLLQRNFIFSSRNQSHHQNSCGEKVFTFSSRVSLAYCAITMDDLHRLTWCLGQPSL